MPYLDEGAECDVTRVGDALPDVVAQTYGKGPVFATPGTWDGTLPLDDASMEGDRYAVKVLWSVTDDYHGPVLIRGRQLDGPHVTLFVPPAPGFPEVREWEGTELTQMFFPSSEPPDGQVARFYPTSALIPQPGCYAFQVDALVRRNYRDVIVLEAVATSGR